MIVSLIAGGLAGAGASQLVTEHRLSVLETDVKHILVDVQFVKALLLEKNESLQHP